jgi:hypothetical protein
MSPFITRIMKLRRMKWSGHEGQVGKTVAYIILVGKQLCLKIGTLKIELM